MLAQNASIITGYARIEGLGPYLGPGFGGQIAMFANGYSRAL